MSAFYQRMAATALRLIGQFGQDCTLRQVTAGGYNPETGGVDEPITAEQPVKAILQDYSLKDSGITNEAGTLIQQGDKKILVAADGVAKPELTDKLVDASGVIWSIVNVKEINPAGVALVYEIQGRL